MYEVCREKASVLRTFKFSLKIIVDPQRGRERFRQDRRKKQLLNTMQTRSKAKPDHQQHSSKRVQANRGSYGEGPLVFFLTVRNDCCAVSHFASS